MKTRGSYPKRSTVKCVCGVVIDTVRVGTGKPWRGGFDYWYEYAEPHECQERKDAQREMEKFRERLA